MTTLGYARVSTNGQDLTAQIEALKAAGAATTYREKVSGVRANGPELAKLMAKLMPGDMVIVTKLDRLGRSTRELLDLIEGKRDLIRDRTSTSAVGIAKVDCVPAGNSHGHGRAAESRPAPSTCARRLMRSC